MPLPTEMVISRDGYRPTREVVTAAGDLTVKLVRTTPHRVKKTSRSTNKEPYYGHESLD